MSEKQLICIICPRGCHLSVDENNNVTGNFCPRGKKYALEELFHSTRTITTTVAIKNGQFPRLSVKTSIPIPKEKIFKIMEILHSLQVDAPIKVGTIIVKNIDGTGSDIVATETILRD